MATHEEILDQQDPSTAPRMSWLATFLWLAIAGAGAYYFYSSNDFFGMAVVAIVLVGALSGFKLGLSRIGISLVALAGAIWFAPSLGMAQEFRFEQWFGTTGLLNRFVSIAAVGIGISFVATLVLMWVAGRILRKRPRLAMTNAWLGFGAGGVQAVAAVLLFVGGLLIIEPVELSRAANPNTVRTPTSQSVSDMVLTITEHAHKSELGELIEEYNPFQRIPQLAQIGKVQKSVTFLSDPAKINELLNHPSITQLQSRPEVRDAVDELMRDPEITNVLNSNGTIDRETAMKLLSHPAVMNLVDQPAFREQASKLINESVLQQVEI